MRKLSLNVFNGKPVADFWKSVEATRKASEEFASKTSTLPADEQVRTVIAMLAELNPDRMPLLEYRIEDEAVSELTMRHSGELGPPWKLSPIRGFSQVRRITIKGGLGEQDLS